MPRSADWFASLSKKAQKEYLAKHPNSKYGKKAPAKTSKPVAAIRQGVTHSMQASAHKRLEKTFKEAQTNLAREKRDLAKAKTPKTIAAAKARIRTLTSVVKHGKAAIAESKKKLDKLAKTKGSNSASKVTTMAMNGKAKKTVSAKAVKTAHDKKRTADKNKVVAKTPSAKRVVKKPTIKANTQKPPKSTPAPASRPRNGVRTPQSAIESAQKRIASARRQLKDVKVGTATYKSLMAGIEREKEMIKKIRARLKK